jgi:GTP pyrophosphokinase
LPGDEIIGYITRGHGVSIHKIDCNNVPKDLEDYPEKDRWIRTTWANNVHIDLNSTLSIFSIDRYGLLADITKAINDMRVVLHAVNARVLKDGNTIVTLSITVESTEHLKNVINKISKIDGVINIERSGL